ncbi:putative acyltransferase [Pedobacter sp. UYP30]|uniref:hypothetical protein n=1 Tax=Pedobacter sp. UYP30 TaxID=1756400 RepID=UPI003399F50D
MILVNNAAAAAHLCSLKHSEWHDCTPTDMIFPFCYWIVDVQNYKRFTTPFVIYGINAITVFFLAGLMP